MSVLGTNNNSLSCFYHWWRIFLFLYFLGLHGALWSGVSSTCSSISTFFWNHKLVFWTYWFLTFKIVLWGEYSTTLHSTCHWGLHSLKHMHILSFYKVNNCEVAVLLLCNRQEIAEKSVPPKQDLTTLPKRSRIWDSYLKIEKVRLIEVEKTYDV